MCSLNIKFSEMEVKLVHEKFTKFKMRLSLLCLVRHNEEERERTIHSSRNAMYFMNLKSLNLYLANLL